MQGYSHKGVREPLETDLIIVTIPRRQDALMRGRKVKYNILPEEKK